MTNATEDPALDKGVRWPPVAYGVRPGELVMIIAISGSGRTQYVHPDGSSLKNNHTEVLMNTRETDDPE